MPVITTTDYRPPFPFTNGHVNTIFPSLFRQQTLPPYRRERITTPDDDFLDIDHLHNGNKSLAILCHGLEGSSASQYIQGTALALHANDWDVTAMNYRSCSGEINRQIRMYHSGATSDLHLIIQYLEKAYERIALVGFSLGGNLVLKYLGDGIYPLNGKIERAAAISVPVDLVGGSVEISKRKNIIYDRRFLKTLRKKILEKHQQFPDAINISDLNKVKTIRDYDDYFTGPIHGFKDAADYYEKCNSKQFLTAIKIPTLLLQALDDPFLPDSCYPIKETELNKQLTLMLSKYGGHVGFSLPGKSHYWEELKILEYLSNR